MSTPPSNNNKTVNMSDDDNIRTTTTIPNPQRHSNGMTPSIITTINNTSPNPQNFDKTSQINNNNPQTNNLHSINSTTTRRRGGRAPIPEPYYESYIEDSFVGHWEREDDDDIDVDNNYTEHGPDGDSDSILHSSTIEFDFDSFGPESIIYAPNNVNYNHVDYSTTSAKKLGQIINNEDDHHQGPCNKTDDKLVRSSTEEINSKPHQDEVVNQDKTEDKLTDDHEQSPLQEIDPTKLPKQFSQGTANGPIFLSQPIDSLDEAQIDLKVIEPYRKVISHAGYCHFRDPLNPSNQLDTNEPAPAVIVFSACYLPDRSRRDYDYVMDHLFLYVLSSLHELIADDYILIYFHNTQPSSVSSTTNGGANAPGTSPSSNQPISNNNLPTFTWIKRCYQLIGRKLRKNLKVLYLVKPTFWLKTIVIMCKPFLSSKIGKKIHFIEDMEGLKKCLPVDRLILPASADNL